jgi:hypothetical protein
MGTDIPTNTNWLTDQVMLTCPIFDGLIGFVYIGTYTV